jgi:long-chain fatty acid transport protein
MRRHLAFSIAGCIALGAHSASAAGLWIDTHSARATGMGASVTGMIDDSSAIFFNPAGIARGRMLDAQVGVSLIMPSITFKDTAGVATSTNFTAAPPFHAYVSGGITEHLSAGVGIFTPYGLTVDWPKGWEGRSIITYGNVATYFINPTLAYQLGPLRVGGGVQIVYGTVDLKRDIALPGGTFGTSQLGADTWGVGANVGVQLDAIPDILSFGLHYRSAVALPFDSGSAHFGDIPAPLSATLHDQPATSRLVTPDSLAFGVALRPIKPLVVDLDAVYVGWHHLKSVDIAFPNDTSGSLGAASSLPKNWSSTVNVHLGGEYAFTDAWRGRLGVIFDPSPAPASTLTPDIPDMWRMNFALGGGYQHRSGLRFDLAYQFLVLFSRTSTAPQLPGSYSGFANIVGLTVGFGTKPSKTD